MILQLAGSGDASAEGDRIEILADGTIVSDGTPRGKIGVFVSTGATLSPSGGPLRLAGEPVEASEGTYEIRQGMLEASNVALSDEMVSMMANVRQAEGAAQLVRLYDQLVGQAVTTFARAGR